ncbi:GAD-like domain-containing protein [Nocardia sp. SYP-A9097]|uniref:GAD-like domain-containing protein n=1 Tax=Nocardia sp. SYP-A9097 TaxID=2663237 RepID=UPI001891639F|nr:GAD-like domain-containing protein [Nocardia sp. SYP-A9097]
MSSFIDEISDFWGAPYKSIPIPAERYEKYRGIVPDLLLEVWRNFGFSGFQDGAVWLCDPDAWQPIVDAWTANLSLATGPDEWLAVTRTAFGHMTLWGRRTGMSLHIVPYRGWIVFDDCSAEMGTGEDRDIQVQAALWTMSSEYAEVIGDDEKPLFPRLLKDLGPIDADTVYGFVPAPALGGAMIPRAAEILDANSYLQLLNEVTGRTVMAENPYN